ncbi:MAG: UDP-N-acetylmuramate dehydrogenase [Alphaproteobacteria bacterium]|nr:UDP-N-acetylmuramate dehydrogenase [Alphaproteobacteria bacterium]
MAASETRGLIQSLPPVRGSYAAEAPLKDLTWFRAGGPAEVLFRPADVDDLADFLRNCPPSVPVTIVGVGSNLLVRDGGIAGVVIRLGSGFNKIVSEPGARVRAGAAALDMAVARAAAEAGIAGLEFLRGIPGTVGGGLAMNAGAYGAEFKDVLVAAVAVTRQGVIETLNAAEMGFSYRSAGAASERIFVEALFQGRPGERLAIEARMAEITQSREATQPVKSRTGGSTFKNPPGQKAWQLIDEAGCRGLTRGDAQVSALHCNFLINRGSASASEIEALGEEVRARVAAHAGVSLEWEIKRIGAKPGERA